MSLSARRAWIEMANFCRNRFCPVVALRKESVDRNVTVGTTAKSCDTRSLSARRAWIEIYFLGMVGNAVAVALRKESVDRNWYIMFSLQHGVPSLSARRAWIEICTLRSRV